MSALTADRNTPSRSGDLIVLPVRSSIATTIFAGSLVCVDSYTGMAVPGGLPEADSPYPLIAIGRAEETVVCPLGATKTVRVRRGVFWFASPMGVPAIGKMAYVMDDQTVAGYGVGRAPAGRVVAAEGSGVWVAVGEPALAATQVYIPIRVATLVGSNVYRAPAPVAGQITMIWSVIEGILTTGDATLTVKNGATAITDGVITITQVGSAAGDVDSATPSALNTVAVGDSLSVTVGGSNATATAANVLIEITH